MQIAEHTVLTELGRLIETISGLSSTAEIYDCIARFIPQILPADHITITQYSESESDGSISILAVYNSKDVHIDLSLGQKIKSFSTYEAYSHSVSRPIIYQPADNLDRNINRMLHEAGIISVLVVPLISGLEIIGTINIASRDHHFGDRDKLKLEKVSALLATSITHTVAFQSNGQIKRQRMYAKHLEHLNVLSEHLLGADSMNDALLLVANCAKELANAGRVSFCELDEDPNFVKILGIVSEDNDTKGTRISLVESGLADCLLNNKKRYATDLLNSENKSQRSLGELGFNHIWSFPITSPGQPRRCLNITSISTELDIDDTISVLNTLTRLTYSTLERIRAEEETVRQAKTDPLTGLCNRKEFNEQLRLAISTASTGNDICIMFLDLDLFKNVNDSMGHTVGDQVLLEVSKRIKETLEGHDTLARIGGDEFMIVLTHMSTRVSVETLAQRLIESVGEPIQLSSHEFNIGVSIGICKYPEHGTDADELIKNSDIAMYRAKEIGRNQFYAFTQSLSDEIKYRSLIQKELVHAVKNDGFSLVYQPQFDIKTMQVTCVEVLLRWHHETLGTIGPDIFIPLAEDRGIIGSVTDWVLKNSLKDLVKWRNQYPDLMLAINISAVEFSPQLDLYNRLTKAIDSSGLNVQDIEIELTETAFLKHPEHASILAQQISDAGIKIALDDFGTGFASLTYLIQLPINRIKIDRSFVDGVEADLKKQAVINGILAIAKGLNIPCLGEGVERQEELNWLARAGCDSAQGYLLSRPIKPEELPSVIESASHWNVKAA